MNTKPGSGGAPIVDGSGNVVAVHYAVHTGTGEGFAVPAEGIRSLLNKP
jgi:S1-C subfamily serine protease